VTRSRRSHGAKSKMNSLKNYHNLNLIVFLKSKKVLPALLK